MKRSSVTRCILDPRCGPGRAVSRLRSRCCGAASRARPAPRRRASCRSPRTAPARSRSSGSRTGSSRSMRRAVRTRPPAPDGHARDALSHEPDLILVPPAPPDREAAVEALRQAESPCSRSRRTSSTRRSRCTGRSPRRSATRSAGAPRRAGSAIRSRGSPRRSVGKRRPLVAALVSLDPLVLAGGHSFVSDLVEVAGAETTHARERGRCALPARVDEIRAARARARARRDARAARRRRAGRRARLVRAGAGRVPRGRCRSALARRRARGRDRARAARRRAARGSARLNSSAAAPARGAR